MGSGMPEIGSRISLISKADIRYEGKLFSVDPEECTIALSSVRSYGTEDRDTLYPVPVQHQVFDYILFRGTDIKDIRVLSTTIPNDPAIVQLTVPPSLNDQQFQSRTGYPQPPVAPMNMPNAPSTSRDQAQGFPSSFAGAVSTRINAADMISKSQSAQNVASEDDSRSSTPSTQNAKNTDATTRVSTGSNKDEQSQMQKKPNNNYNRDKPQGGNRYQQQAPRQQYQQRYQQQNRHQNHQSQQQQQPRYMLQQHQQTQYRDYNRDNQYRNYNDYRDFYGPRQYMQPLRNQQYDQRRNNRMGQNAQPRSNNYQSTGYQNQNRKPPRNTLKFDDDYDFEQANSEFEQMRTQLEKTKLDDTIATTTLTTTAVAPKLNGDVERKKEDSGNEGVVSGGEENDPDKEDPIYYDKVKSFFDQISYEAIERSKGLTTRMDWKTERKINSETFGSLALRRNSNFHGGRGGQNTGGYYNNYQNRNANVSNNNYRGRYRQLQQPNPRRSYNNTANKSHETAAT